MTDVEYLFVRAQDSVRRALEKLESSGMGLVLLVDANGKFGRTVTDGDVRRLILKSGNMEVALSALPTITSITVGERATRGEVLQLMNAHGIDQIPVVDGSGHVVSMLERRHLGPQILLSTPHMGTLERDYVEEAFRTNWIAPLGPNVDAFEQELAALVGVGHAAALSSGTAAIHLALRILNVGPGDRVFCSTFTFAASANPIVYQGAAPVFIDSEPASWNMSPAALEVALESAKRQGWAPKAVIVVNLYGQSADMDPILNLCRAYGVPVVEDAAESLGARYCGRPSGSFGLMGVFSFNGNKIITTSGGGMLVSNDEDIIGRARYLATQARDPAPHYQHSEIGYNYRLSNILAGVGRGQIKVLQDRVDARRRVFASYRESLADLPGLHWMPEPSWSYSTHWLSTLTIDEAVAGVSARDVIGHLAQDLIEARALWKPLHSQPVFSACRFHRHPESVGNESVSDTLFRSGLCLPSGSNMSDDAIGRVSDSIRKIIKGRRADGKKAS